MIKACTKDAKALQIIKAWLDKKGYPPSVRELGEELGMRGIQTVFDLLTRLERDGHIYRIPNVARNIRLGNPLGRFSDRELRSELYRRRKVAA